SDTATGDATATQIASRPKRKLIARHTGSGVAEAVRICIQPRRYTAAANTIAAVQAACAYGNIVVLMAARSPLRAPHHAREAARPGAALPERPQEPSSPTASDFCHRQACCRLPESPAGSVGRA